MGSNGLRPRTWQKSPRVGNGPDRPPEGKCKLPHIGVGYEILNDYAVLKYPPLTCDHNTTFLQDKPAVLKMGTGTVISVIRGPRRKVTGTSVLPRPRRH